VETRDILLKYPELPRPRVVDAREVLREVVDTYPAKPRPCVVDVREA
jgi:hypothetical protein